MKYYEFNTKVWEVNYGKSKILSELQENGHSDQEIQLVHRHFSRRLVVVSAFLFVEGQKVPHMPFQMYVGREGTGKGLCCGVIAAIWRKNTEKRAPMSAFCSLLAIGLTYTSVRAVICIP